MFKRTGIITAFILLTLLAGAQQKLSYPEVDKTSYELFLQGNWEELIRYSDRARSQGIDFFYLQARTGIAFYNKEKYRTAAKWFLKAWEANPDQEWLQEYLYYSLLFGGRSADAGKLAGSFLTGIQEKLGYIDRGVITVGLETGYGFNSGYNKLLSEPPVQFQASGEEYGEAFYFRNHHFESFSLNHRLSPSVLFHHNLTYTGVNWGQRVDWGSPFNFSSGTSQFQYFFNAHLVPGRKVNVSPSLSLLWGELSYVTGGLRGNNREIYNTGMKYSDVVASLSAWTDFGNFSPGAELNFARISDKRFWQSSVWLTIYPLSNLNLYFTPRAFFKSEPASGTRFYAFGLSGGFQLGQLHLYGQYLNGDMENLVEAGGYVVSNFPGKSKQKISAGLFFPMNKKYRFVVRYITQDVTENYLVYTNFARIREWKYDYMKQTITAGISWSF